jgi:hypothetical protein
MYWRMMLLRVYLLIQSTPHSAPALGAVLIVRPAASRPPTNSCFVAVSCMLSSLSHYDPYRQSAVAYFGHLVRAGSVPQTAPSAVDCQRQPDLLDELSVGDGAGVFAEYPFDDRGLGGGIAPA